MSAEPRAAAASAAAGVAVSMRGVRAAALTPTDGTITLDGADLRHIPDAEIRRRVPSHATHRVWRQPVRWGAAYGNDNAWSAC